MRLKQEGIKRKEKEQVIYPSVAYELGAQITERTGQEVRVTVPGHTREAASRVRMTGCFLPVWCGSGKADPGKEIWLYGSSAEQRDYGSSAGGGCRKVKDGRSELLHDQEAKMIGISFGDE